MMNCRPADPEPNTNSNRLFRYLFQLLAI